MKDAPEIFDARSGVSALADMPEGESVANIQWMPAGKHVINCTKNGKPATVTVDVTAETAAAVAKQLDEMLKAGKKPFIDFNHEGGRSAGRVISVTWEGEDPKNGGIRASVKLTASARTAIRDGEYSHFSPTFRVGKDGKIAGTTLNMGGLVNDPAFEDIQTVTAKSSPESSPETQPTEPMKELIALLVSEGLCSAGATDEAAIVPEVKAALEKRTKDHTATLEAARAEVATLTEKVTAAKRTHAESLVDAACTAGKIASKDETTRKFWVETIVTAGKTAEDALAAIPVPAALNPAPVVNAAKSDSVPQALDGVSLLRKQDAAIAEARRELGADSTFEAAFTAAAAKHPDLFR